MCGRVAQTLQSTISAWNMLSNVSAEDETTEREPGPETESCVSDTPSPAAAGSHGNNYNLAPGMTSVIFHKKCEAEQDSHICSTADKVWGICPKSGTKNHPLPPGPGKHFSNLMFNARSETLYEKRTFKNLALTGNTCIWAIDGFYEWKEPIKNAVAKSTTKQPYFVHRKDGLPLIIPGLFTKVKTGRMTPEEGEEEILETFTLITTAACEPLRWLHHRQPVFIWDMHLAREWILNPTQELLEKMAKLATDDGKNNGSGTCGDDKSATATGSNKDEATNDELNNESLLAWHPVSKRMSNIKYREADCMDEIKVEQVASIKSFFGTGTSSGKTKTSVSHDQKTTAKRSSTESVTEKIIPAKKMKTMKKKTSPKKGSITNFFAPKER